MLGKLIALLIILVIIVAAFRALRTWSGSGGGLLRDLYRLIV